MHAEKLNVARCIRIERAVRIRGQQIARENRPRRQIGRHVHTIRLAGNRFPRQGHGLIGSGN